MPIGRVEELPLLHPQEEVLLEALRTNLASNCNLIKVKVRPLYATLRRKGMKVCHDVVKHVAPQKVTTFSEMQKATHSSTAKRGRVTTLGHVTKETNGEEDYLHSNCHAN